MDNNEQQGLWAAGLAAVAGLGGGLFGFLRAKSDAAPKLEAEETSQLSILAKVVEAQAQQLASVQSQLASVLSLCEKQSGKISAQAAQLDELRSRVRALTDQLAEAETQRDSERERVDELSAHLDALLAQIVALNAEPVPAPPKAKAPPRTSRKR